MTHEAEGASIPTTFAKRAVMWITSVAVVIVVLPFPFNDLLPGSDFAWQAQTAFWNAIVPGVATHILRWTTLVDHAEPVADTDFYAARCVAIGLLSLVLGTLGAAADATGRSAIRLRRWAHPYARYFLAATLVGYGAIKLIPTQFHVVSLRYLAEPLGYRTPVGLLWTFMAASPLYTVFTGAVEVLAGSLLPFQRTAALGSVLALGAMGNVTLLNIGYQDGGAKLFSIQIFAVALYVFAPYARRVASALVTDRSVPPTSVMAPFNTPRLNNAARALGLLVVAYSLGSSLADSWQDYRADHSRETADLAGVYDVGSYVTRGQDNATRQPTPWVELIIERFGIATVRLRGDTTESYHVLHQPNTDSLQMTGAFDIRVVGPSDTTSHARFTYSRPNESELLLYGVVNDDSVTVRLRRVDTSKFRLMSQPFHWVQGRPGPSAY